MCCEACGRLYAALCRKFQASHWHANARVNRRQRYGEPLKHLPVTSARTERTGAMTAATEVEEYRTKATPYLQSFRTAPGNNNAVYRDARIRDIICKVNYLINHRINLGGFH